MINSKMIFRILGFLLLIETVMLLCCGGVSLFYKENDLQSFLVSSAITTSIGILLLAIGSYHTFTKFRVAYHAVHSFV